MIKVLNRDVPEEKIYHTTCEDCGAKLEFMAEDTHEGYAGYQHVTCPMCNYEIMVEELDGIELNSDNVEFPKHFYSYKNGVDVGDKRIQEWVRSCLRAAEESDEPYGYFTHAGSGNSVVILMVYEDEYNIVVAKDYYELSITRE